MTVGPASCADRNPSPRKRSTDHDLLAALPCLRFLTFTTSLKKCDIRMITALSGIYVLSKRTGHDIHSDLWSARVVQDGRSSRVQPPITRHFLCYELHELIADGKGGESPRGIHDSSV
ncbi:hypothetical protein BaRGS_00031970 [Batillaria attramentaria]|uniref:Uncharacterized protein n=1 Tax=Batillaria attramentaria TaxID=370345 RepID=A0ABD0JP09_9CAEN